MLLSAWNMEGGNPSLEHWMIMTSRKSMHAEFGSRAGLIVSFEDDNKGRTLEYG